MRICITGGAGSISGAVIKLLIRTDWKIRILDNDQHGIHVLTGFYGNRLEYCQGDVRDTLRLGEVFEDCDVVLHTAALKYVNLCEDAPGETRKTNCGGTLNACIKASQCGVDKFLFMSTDKAVNPKSVMGSTKKDAENSILTSVFSGKTKFSIIRSGNAVGSEGCFFDSVGGLISKKKSVPITSLAASRFWIQIEALAEFIISCMDKMEGGEIFIPEMEHDNVYSYLKKRYGKFKYHTIGLRPGEKLVEELLNDDEEITEDIDGWGKIIRRIPCSEKG